jgi:hypothetical protein
VAKSVVPFTTLAVIRFPVANVFVKMALQQTGP